jgi:hypothetical protein
LASKYCIGGFDLSTKRAICCPYQQEVNDKSLHCSSCSNSIQFNPAFYHVAISQLSQQQKTYNLQTHVVYLAYFGKDIIKVGIANEKRIRTRWLEQGARAAVVLQRLQDAYAARALEEYISVTHNIPERITIKQKRQSLHIPYCFGEASIKLDTCRSAISASLNSLLANEPIQDLQYAYWHGKQPFPLYEIPQGGQHNVAGCGLGMVGEMFIYERNGYSFLQPLKPLLGQAQIRLEKEEVHTAINIQTKLNLFG